MSDDDHGGRSRRARRLDLELLLAVLFVVLLNALHLSPRVVPIHDTFYNLANFHIVYGELLFHGTLPRWYPYGTYGLPSDLEQAASLSAASYAVALAGALLGVRDVLLLFKIGAIAEQLAFVLGVHLLGRRVFASRATTLLLCIAAAGSVVWNGQQWWDFRLYYLLPLVLYFVTAFVETRRPHFFWAAGIAGVAWALGIPPYATPVLALGVAVVGAFAAGRDAPRLLARLAEPSAANALSLAAFAAMAAAYAWFVTHALDHVSLHAPGRDAATGRVSAETFRTYGGNANLLVVANAFLFGWPLQLPWGNGADNSVYIGLLPWLGVAVAAVRERSRLFVGLLAAALVLILLSLGGAFTRLAYHLPGFGYYRHVGLVFGLVKVLVLLASGFGLERLWALGAPRLSHPLFALAAGALLLEAGFACLQAAGPGVWLRSGPSHVLVRLSAYAALLVAARVLRAPLRWPLALGLAADVALFQLALWELRIPILPPRERPLLAALAAREVVYRPIRQQEPQPPPGPDRTEAEAATARSALELAARQQRVGPGIKELYWYVYQFASFDPCKSRHRTDYLPAGVDRLFRVQERAGFELAPIVGCGRPKLRLTSAVRFARDLAEAEALLPAARAAPDAPTVIVRQSPPSAPAAPAGPVRGEVRVTAFELGLLEAEVRVDAPEGAWLVYADAYHPGWRAAVNGRAASVDVADLAFKAVAVPPGRSTVRLWFDHGANAWLRWVVAGFGASAAAAALVGLVAALYPRRPRVAGDG